MKNEINESIFDQLQEMFEKLSPYLNQFRKEETKDKDVFRVNPDFFDTTKIVDAEMEVDFFNQLSEILELIYGKKQFCLLIADIAHILASIDASVFFTKSQRYIIPSSDMDLIEERYFIHLRIAREHLGMYFFKKYPSEQLSWIENINYGNIADKVTFLYSENKDPIEKLNKIWLDTRYYFEYDNEYAMLGGVYASIIFSSFVGQLYWLKKMEDASLDIFPKHKKEYIDRYWKG